MLHACLLAAFLACVFPPAGAQVTKQPASLSVEEVVEMNKEGFAEDVIVTSE